MDGVETRTRSKTKRVKNPETGPNPDDILYSWWSVTSEQALTLMKE